jgi:hypothetical protein
MRRILFLVYTILIASPLFAQRLAGKWLVYEGSDGSELVVTLASGGTGNADLTLVRRSEAVPYGEGSQFWGTFLTTGGYYFLVKGSKKVGVRVSQSDSTFVVKQLGQPAVSVTAWLDEPYSTRELSDYGDYKKQVVAQWKRDFLTNEDVKKGKWMMEHYFSDFYGDAFEVLLEGKYRIVESTDSTIVLKKLSLEIPLMTWKRIQQ